jgi:hypothetical protein
MWSFTPREEHKLGVLENRATGCWRKINNEELHSLYSLSNIIRVIKSGRMG